MPQAALEPVAAPLELEDNWPLQAHGDALELPDAAGGLGFAKGSFPRRFDGPKRVIFSFFSHGKVEFFGDVRGKPMVSFPRF